MRADQVEPLWEECQVLYKRGAASGCSCGSLGTCMQMSWVVNPLLPVQSWYSPWKGECCVYGCCQSEHREGERERGEEYGGGPCSSHCRLNGFHQPITAGTHQLYSSPSPRPHTTTIRYPSRGACGGMKWEWDDNEQWMSHASSSGLQPGELATAVGRWRGELFSKIMLPQKLITTELKHKSCRHPTKIEHPASSMRAKWCSNFHIYEMKKQRKLQIITRHRYHCKHNKNYTLKESMLNVILWFYFF